MHANLGEPIAVVGGRLASRLEDCTSDLSALDSAGFWVVVLPFEGEPVCARFGRVTRRWEYPVSVWVGPDPTQWTSSLDLEEYRPRVEAIRDGIARGDVYQVNLCRVLSAPVGEVDVLALGARLAAGNPAPHSAIVRLPARGLDIASASPECFLRRDGERVQSRPIKGSASVRDGFSPKDRAENLMIVDLVRNDLGRVCEYASVEVPRLCEVEEHPGIWHLVSTVSGKLRPGTPWPELLEATFPPGSVTGAPKSAALRFISRLEPESRGIYCGAIGWVDADAEQAELNVAIRTFWARDGQLKFGTGGAITWDSNPEDEWRETVLKARRLVGLASGGARGGGEPSAVEDPSKLA